MHRWIAVACLISVNAWSQAPNPDRNAYFGDLHVHTRYSFDAYIFSVRTTPDDAYRYARGATLNHAFGYPIRLRGPALDFMAVTDHATYMGVLHAMGDPEHELSETPLAKELINSDPAVFVPAFRSVAQAIITGKPDPRLQHPEVVKQTWQREIEAAERHNAPGTFTTFVGYEYTSAPPFNLHRNVIFKGAQVPQAPFAATDSLNPEDLWDWMDANRAAGMEALAIPHNPNWSNGTMFMRETFEGKPLDRSYAEQRMRNEPLVEIAQVKGASDTHPLLSPNDEWAEFEIFGDNPKIYRALGDGKAFSIKLSGSYVRDALLTGLEFDETKGFNPYHFGLMGSSDTHNAGAPYEEGHFYSKTGINDGSPQRRGSVPPEGVDSWEDFAALPAEKKPASYLADWGAAGLAGVWAEENTRDAIYAALRRKETFGTSGTRIRVRFFAAYALDDVDLDSTETVSRLYANGVSMGGDLLVRDKVAPVFAAWATRDPQSAWLQRMQVVKGWIASGKRQEQVYDIACSDGALPNPNTHRCPDNGASVDLETCNYDFDVGAAELKTTWRDPDFDPAQRAFYYLRVLENPTCRWTTWDAMRAGIDPKPGYPATIQERAWSSPIWVLPAAR